MPLLQDAVPRHAHFVGKVLTFLSLLIGLVCAMLLSQVPGTVGQDVEHSAVPKFPITMINRPLGFQPVQAQLGFRPVNMQPGFRSVPRLGELRADASKNNMYNEKQKMLQKNRKSQTRKMNEPVGQYIDNEGYVDPNYVEMQTAGDLFRKLTRCAGLWWNIPNFVMRTLFKGKRK